MARSIHTTWKTVSGILIQNFKTEEEREAALEEALRQKRRKRRIKKSVRRERHAVPPPLVKTAPETIPIEILDASSTVHFPVTSDELREVIALLPEAAIDGISKIHLSLGKAYMDEQEWDDGDKRDPHTGRLAGVLLPGIYSGPVLGTYSRNSNRVAMYAYVYDAAALAALPLSGAAVELYLRLHFLKTFVHEVAHHHDAIQRVRRGRWLADRKANNENYAERMEYEWTRQYVIPFLVKKYPIEHTELIDWIAQWGGARLDLAFLAGDPRTTKRDGSSLLLWSTHTAFECFVDEFQKLPQPVSKTESRLAFAWEVHYSDKYDLCLQIVEDILAAEPKNVKALVCKADTLEHLEKLDEAWNTAGDALKIDPHNDGAWEMRARVQERKKAWTEVLRICDEWEKALHPESKDKGKVFKYRAIACCALDRIEEMESSIAAWLKTGLTSRREEVIRRTIFRRAGKPYSKN